jgi:putative nucleotidyltransferase with HDIG domain
MKITLLQHIEVDSFRKENHEGKDKRSLLSNQIYFIGNFLDHIRQNPISLLRACRFTALGQNWTLTDQTIELVKLHKFSVYSISPEVIREEFIGAFKSDYPTNFIRALYDTELLQLFLPDVLNCWNLAGGSWHDETVGQHLLLTCEAATRRDKRWQFRLAAFFHDIGKFQTYNKDENGKITFYSHEVVGANIAREWMKSLHFDDKDTEYVEKLVRNHMFRLDATTKERTLLKFLNKIGPGIWPDLLKLRICDREGNLGKHDRAIVTEKMKELDTRLNEILKGGLPIFKEDLAINDNDLFNLKIKPELKNEIYQNIMGIVWSKPERNTKDWLISYIKRNFK